MKLKTGNDRAKMPKCKVCGEEYPKKRASLGYQTCLKHGEAPKQYTVAPVWNKGAYQLITRENVTSIGRK
jgi:hypothetical protein